MRHTFFSFHYADVWRCMQVRNCWVGIGKNATGFVDSAEFEKVEKQGNAAIKRWIDNQMKGASVTVVLIGSETGKKDHMSNMKLNNLGIMQWVLWGFISTA